MHVYKHHTSTKAGINAVHNVKLNGYVIISLFSDQANGGIVCVLFIFAVITRLV